MSSVRAIITFMVIMWGMIIVVGGIAVITINSIFITGYGDLGNIITVILKILGILGLITAWIFALSKLKNVIFKKQLFN